MVQIMRKIVLLHHTGLGNLGDDAVVSSVIGNIRERWPDAEFAILSMNAKKTAERHKLPSYPIRRYQFELEEKPAAFEPIQVRRGRFRHWFGKTRDRAIRKPRAALSELNFLINAYRFLKPFDLLIVTGGGQLTERGGLWSSAYALFIWSWMAKLAGTRFMLLSVGAGPLDRPLSKFFISRTLRRAEYFSFRDEESQELIRGLGFSEPGNVCPDNAYALKDLPAAAATKKPIGRVVGVAPMAFPFIDLPRSPENAKEIQGELASKMATFASMLVSNSFSLKLFGSDAGADPPEIRDLQAVLLNRYSIPLPEYVPPNSVSGLLEEMAELDYVVTCRFHGVVFAHMLNKPVLAIAHHPKVTHLMGALGLSEYCVDMVTFDPIQLWEKFQALVANADTVKEEMAVSLAKYRTRSTAQFDALFLPEGFDAQPGNPPVNGKNSIDVSIEKIMPRA
jgi:polysaccharide pyruvyl transferase WcaK-like protein